MNSTESLNYYNQHKQTFDAWLSIGEKINVGNGLVAPLISYYEETTGFKINGCPDCISDMLVWYSTQENKKKKKHD